MPEYRLINFNELHKADIIFTTQRDSAISASIRTATNSVISRKAGFIFLILVIVSSSCKTIYRSGFVSVPRQLISDSLKIGPEWTEVVPPAPLKPYGTVQEVFIAYQNYDRKGSSFNEIEGTLILSDGRKTRIEAFLFDDQGESYQLQIAGVGGGVLFVRKTANENDEGKNKSIYQHFPVDRTYTKLKIRSEIPLNCEFIEWIDYNPK